MLFVRRLFSPSPSAVHGSSKVFDKCLLSKGRSEQRSHLSLTLETPLHREARRVGAAAGAGTGALPFFRRELEQLHPFHIKMNYTVSLPRSKTDGHTDRTRGTRPEKQANGPQHLSPSSLGSSPRTRVTSREKAASSLSSRRSEIGTWISSGWLKLNPDKSRAMLIGSGEEFEEVTRNATSSAMRSAFPQSGRGRDCPATGAQRNADKRTSLS